MKQIAFFGIIFFIIVQYKTSAQSNNRYTLQQCIDTALAKNIEIKQAHLLVDAAAVNRRQAKVNMLPDANVGFTHGVNQGRSIDPFTNTYINQAINYASYGINSGVVLFNGMSLQHAIRQYAYAYDASRMELQYAKDNLTLDVILAYLQVLNNEDLLSSSVSQKELTAKQLERLEVLNSQGAISPSQASDLKGQLMNDQLSILNIGNQLESSRLNLTQLMNITYDKSMSLERIEAEEIFTTYNLSSMQIYETALQQFSLIKSVGLRKKSAVYAFRSAKGLLLPSLILGGNFQTNYSSAAQNANGKIRYNEQVVNNVFSGLNVGLRIPVFNAFRTKYTVKLAGITVRNNELIEENTRIILRQQIEQAYLNMTYAYERYKTLLEQVAAYKTSFTAAEARFSAGVGNTVDYLIAKNNVDRAAINLISAKYDLVLRKKVLDYYQNTGSYK